MVGISPGVIIGILLHGLESKGFLSPEWKDHLD
jgi:DNA-binding PadR family transcriptional regulator